MKKSLRFTSIILAFLFVFVSSSVVEAKKKKDKDKEDDNGKPYESVIKDFEKIEGLFTFYVKPDEGQVYMSITPDQLDQIYLCSVTRSAGDGTYYDNGADQGEFPYIFKRVGKKIQMVIKNVRFRADTTTALWRALDRGVSNSIYVVAKIESETDKDTKAV